jgi:RNA polymerase sigma factor (sigma-70 family)
MAAATGLSLVNPPPSNSESASAEAHARWFNDKVHPHDSALKAYLRGAFPAVRDVEDVVQESYLRVWTARAAQPIRSAKAYLFTVARRLAVDLIRRERRSPLVAVKEIDTLFVLADAPDASAAAVSAEDVRLLADAIASLPARCREIFILCQIEGHAQRVVAERLGISENTVAVQSARGLLRCEEFVRRRLKQP